jgi:DNA modification methylase
MLTQLYGDCRDVLPTLDADSVHLCITSPPYFGLRAYSDDPREIGREQTPDAYIAALVAVFREVRRALRGDGVCVLNLGDSYANDEKWGGASGGKHAKGLHGATGVGRERKATGAKPKDKLLIPHRVALALQADGWYVRQDMPWLKRNSMPESVTDRPSVAHEYVFILACSPRYWWDAEAVRVAAQDWGTRRREGDKQTRTPGQAPHNGLKDLNFAAAGRNYRTTDPWFASLDAEIAYTRARLAELERLRERGGLLTDDDGEALALPVNPRPYSGAHFAVFPPSLVEPFIKAACPRQCCPTCGAGYTRVVERNAETHNTAEGARQAARSAGAQTGGVAKVTLGVTEGVRRTDLGFHPACACPPAEPVPGVALDPFGGSGTVGEVAIAHGRRAILIELNEGYAPLQDGRTDGVQINLFDA